MRLILDPPAGGAWNMAVDEALLADAAEHGQATLRFYQWSEPTLSLGYFQRHAERASHPASQACPWVRRASGGGAIVHDRELTYSLAMPISRQQFSAADLYALMHMSLVAALAQLGVIAWRHREGGQTVTPGRSPGAPGPDGTLSFNASRGPSQLPQPFLCFRRHTEGDVLCGGVKIAGSAQRRRRAETSIDVAPLVAAEHGQQSGAAAVLQHGSVLLSRSTAASELEGIEDVTGRKIAPRELIELWLNALAEQGLEPWQRSPLPGSVQEAAQRISSEKYEASEWNQRR